MRAKKAPHQNASHEGGDLEKAQILDFIKLKTRVTPIEWLFENAKFQNEKTNDDWVETRQNLQ